MEFRYPQTPEAKAATTMLGGPAVEPVPQHVSDQFSRVNQLFGSRDLDRVARNPGAAGVVPWPLAGKTKKGPNYDRSAVREALTSPRSEKVVQPSDPRHLHASQNGVTRDGVEYYMGDDYATTGRTYADQGNAGNAQPVVYNKSDGRKILLSGHHRATAALLKGEQFDALQVYGD